MHQQSRIKEFDPSLPSPGLGRGQGRGRTIIQIISNTAIGVSPAKLDFNLKKGESATQKIFLQNLDESPTKVSLTLENPKYNEQISINPEELILPGKRIEEVEIKVSSKKSFNIELEILSLTQTNSELNIASGVKLPLEVEIENSFAIFPLLLAVALAVAVTSIFYLFHRRSRSFLPRAKGEIERG